MAKSTLANGAPLTKETFEDFKKRLFVSCKPNNIDCPTLGNTIYIVEQKLSGYMSGNSCGDYWEYFSTHFTKEAAQFFVDDNQKNNFAEFQIADSYRSECNEYNAIIQGILDGKIGYID